MQLAHKTAALWGLEKTLFGESQNAGGVTGARAHGWLGKTAVPRVARSASETPTPAEQRHHKSVGACAVVLTQTEARFHFLGGLRPGHPPGAILASLG